MSQRRRVGVLGGTFDPPHVGHLVTAADVRHELELDEVLLVVANEPWQKVGRRRVTPARLRYELTRSAVEGEPGLVASDLELRRGGPSYTVDTLTDLHRSAPDADLVLILGSDAAAGLDTWERSDHLGELCSIVVVERPGGSTEVPAGFKVRHLEVPRLEVSSTDLRDRVRSGRPVRHLLPDAVVSLIREAGLYG